MGNFRSAGLNIQGAKSQFFNFSTPPMILHLDMDAFFASVEQLDYPELRGKPIIVGGGERGVVATASYEARVFGVHSAMPAAIARKLCPGGIFVRGRGWRYSELSKKVMASLHDFSPIVQQASIDEAYLDARGLEKLFGQPEDLARAVKARVAEVTGGLTCSIGMAPIKFLAKICSDQNKPNGIFILRPEEMDAFLLNLKVEKLPGVGQAMRGSLQNFGIFTVAQLRELSREFMEQRYGKWGLELYARAHGIDPRPVRPNPPAKSESAESTFSRDIFDKKILSQILWEHAQKVGQRLRKHQLAGRAITIKIKFADFRQITRTRTIDIKTNSTRTIYEVANILLENIELRQPVRLIGVGVSGFEDRPRQLWLPGLPRHASSAAMLASIHEDAAEAGRASLDRALDSINQRFGKGSVSFGMPDDRPACPHHLDSKASKKN